MGSSTGSAKTKHTHGTRSRKSCGETGAQPDSVSDRLARRDCRKNVNLRSKCDEPDFGKLTNELESTRKDCKELKHDKELATEADTKDCVCKKDGTVDGVATRTRHHVSQNTQVALVNSAVNDCETKPEPLPAVSTAEEGSALSSRTRRSKFKLKKDKPTADNIVVEKAPGEMHCEETVPLASAAVEEAMRSKGECPPDGGSENTAIQSAATVGRKVADVNRPAGDSRLTDTSLSETQDNGTRIGDEAEIVEVSA